MKYIRFNTSTNKVVAVCLSKPLVEESEFVSLSGAYAVAEFNGEIPKSDYLTVANVQTKTDKWTEQKTEYIPLENGEYEEKQVSIEKLRTYLVCDLVTNFYSEIELTEEQKEKQYNSLVTKLIRQKYSADAVEALLANYTEDAIKYQTEFVEFAAYRKECKAKARQKTYNL